MKPVRLIPRHDTIKIFGHQLNATGSGLIASTLNWNYPKGITDSVFWQVVKPLSRAENMVYQQSHLLVMSALNQ